MFVNLWDLAIVKKKSKNRNNLKQLPFSNNGQNSVVVCVPPCHHFNRLQSPSSSLSYLVMGISLPIPSPHRLEEQLTCADQLWVLPQHFSLTVWTLGHSRVPISILWSNSPCRFCGMLWVSVSLHHLLPSHLQLSEFWSRMCGLIWNFPGRKAAQTFFDIAVFFFLQVWWFRFWSNNCHQSRERNSRRTLLSLWPEGCGSCRNPPINVMASQSKFWGTHTDPRCFSSAQHSTAML